MKGTVFEQAESFLKPLSDMFTLNIEALNLIHEKQTDLVTGLVSDSLDYTKGVATSALDIGEFVEVQKRFWEGVQSKVNDNTHDNIVLINDVQSKLGDVIQKTWTPLNAPEVEKPVRKSAARKKPAVKKSSAKKKAAKASNAKTLSSDS